MTVADYRPKDPAEVEAWEAMRRSLVEFANLSCEEAAFCSQEMTPIERMVYFALRAREPYTAIRVKSQFHIGPYRADFLVTWEYSPEKIVIECDGHDFHEKTKEQAQHDKKRDREMQAAGYKVYRFTGSEIWKSRGRCVVEALELV
jgi:very-short-patch-repair endonuclease